MPRDLRDGSFVISLSGERAQALAARLLAPRPAADALWDDIAGLAGPAHRLSHDWDPATGRLTLAARA